MDNYPKLVGHSNSGKILHGFLEKFSHREIMRNKWKNQMYQYETILKRNSGANVSEIRKCIDDAYMWSNITWTFDDMQYFVDGDFENKLWENVINEAQDNVPPNNQTHLHAANELLSGFLSSNIKTILPYNDNGSAISILETGVGGANTTYKVCNAIFEKYPKLIIEYKGYEINPGFTQQLNEIMKGNCITHSSKKDSRVDFFRKNRERFIPWSIYQGENNNFVENREMYEAIINLSKDLYEKIHLFICSYTLHHVPNSIRLIEFLFNINPGKHNLAFYKVSRNKQEDFLHNFIGRLKEISNRKETYYTSTFNSNEIQNPLAHVLLTSLSYYKMEDSDFKNIIKDFEKYKNVTEWKPDMLYGFVEDRQKHLLSKIYKLLIPGGFIGIADPDGFSDFNRASLVNNPEMGVAHFRSREEMRQLLTDLNFEILEEGNQLSCIEGLESKYEFVNDRNDEIHKIGIKQGINDNNLGYLFIAKKPFTKD
jgi:hypothetical protein